MRMALLTEQLRTPISSLLRSPLNTNMDGQITGQHDLTYLTLVCCSSILSPLFIFSPTREKVPCCSV